MNLLTTHVFKLSKLDTSFIPLNTLFDLIMNTHPEIVIGGSVGLCMLGILDRPMHDLDFCVERKHRKTVHREIMKLGKLRNFNQTAISKEKYKDHHRYVVGGDEFCVFFKDSVDYILVEPLHQGCNPIRIINPEVILDAKYDITDELEDVPPHYREGQLQKHMDDIDEMLPYFNGFMETLKMAMI